MSTATGNWIINLTQKKPILGLVAALIAGISATSGVIVYKDFQHRKDITVKDAEIRTLNIRLEKKDSIQREQLLFVQATADRKVQDFMAGIIADQKETIKKQEIIEEQRRGIYRKNNQIIIKSSTIINKLDKNGQK